MHEEGFEGGREVAKRCRRQVLVMEDERKTLRERGADCANDAEGSHGGRHGCRGPAQCDSIALETT